MTDVDEEVGGVGAVGHVLEVGGYKLEARVCVCFIVGVNCGGIDINCEVEKINSEAISINCVIFNVN